MEKQQIIEASKILFDHKLNKILDASIICCLFIIILKIGSYVHKYQDFLYIFFYIHLEHS